jgi:hypothetical protein
VARQERSVDAKDAGRHEDVLRFDPILLHQNWSGIETQKKKPTKNQTNKQTSKHNIAIATSNVIDFFIPWS